MRMMPRAVTKEVQSYKGTALNMFYIYHHLGLGDHVICNGIVHHLLEKHNKIGLFCHGHYYKNVKLLYKDTPNVEVLPFEKESEIVKFLSLIPEDQYKKIGFEKLTGYSEKGLSFDEAFYDLAGIDFNIRFEKFHLPRDEESEQKILNELNPAGEKFIYVHDDPSRGFKIRENSHRNDLKIIRNNYKFNLYEMFSIAVQAEEIHTMRTGMLDLINGYNLNNTKLYVHEYVRNYDKFVHSKGLNEVISIS